MTTPPAHGDPEHGDPDRSDPDRGSGSSSGSGSGSGSNGAREEILRRIRHALADRPRDEDPRTAYAAIPRPYATAPPVPRTPRQTADLLAAHLTDYRAHVHRTDEHRLPDTIAALLARHGTRTLTAPPGLPRHWLTRVADIPLIPDAPGLTPQDLDAVDTVLTGCTLAIADTGTLILDASPDQGHRRLTLVPDHHICVVHPRQIVDTVPQALARLDPARPQTWISGPSATSDIELHRVEGVHGPRTLDVILVGPPGDDGADPGDSPGAPG